MELSQIDKGYLQQLIAYNKILNERNNLLKQINLYPALIETLDGWDEQLLTAGQFLIKKREEFVQFLDEMMARIHSQLTGGKEQMKVEYEKNVSAEEFREQLYSRRNKDISSGTKQQVHTGMIFVLRSEGSTFVSLVRRDSKERQHCH